MNATLCPVPVPAATYHRFTIRGTVYQVPAQSVRAEWPVYRNNQPVGVIVNGTTPRTRELRWAPILPDGPLLLSQPTFRAALVLLHAALEAPL